MHSISIAVPLATLIVSLAVESSWAGPTVTVGAIVPEAARLPLDQIDHASWSRLLQKYVDAHGYVAYADWKANDRDRTALTDYLNQLARGALDRPSPKEAQLAFWINAYNSVTVWGILREYPTTSIRNHTAKLFGFNIWKDLKLSVAAKPFSLDDIEHQVLRKMGEPRIHFAIVCASVGCPRLRNEAYVADRLDMQLTTNAQAFFADRTKFTADPRSRTIAVSPLLDWFGEDFGPDTAARMQAIAPYVPESVQSFTRSFSGDLQFLEYDWGLNDQAQRRE